MTSCEQLRYLPCRLRFNVGREGRAAGPDTSIAAVKVLRRTRESSGRLPASNVCLVPGWVKRATRKQYEHCAESVSPPRFLQLLRHIIPPGIGHLGVLHSRLNIRVPDPILQPLHAESLAKLVRGAAMLQYMKMPKERWDARRGAVLLHQQMERGAVDRPLLLRQEHRAPERIRAP